MLLSVRAAAVAFVATNAVLITAAPSSAALDFNPCPAFAKARCATIDVPVDRSGAVPGTITLDVERIPAPHPAGRPPLVFLAGGPGQTNTAIFPLFAHEYARAVDDRDLVTFALRGTGTSAIDCPEIDRGDPAASAVPACAQSLGPARNFYTTRDAADDLDDVRQALGVDKLALYGGSYGTRLEQAYAIRHADHVERMVLDSTYGPDLNNDPFGVGEFKAAPEVARAICHRNACKGITKNPYADLLELFAKLSEKPIDTSVVDAQGKPHKTPLAALLVAALLPSLDVDDNLRAELPRAIEGALHGDPAVLGRLVAGGPSGPPPDARLGVNQTLFTATRCEEDVQPFDRTASPDDRIAEAHQQLAAIPPATFAPFGADIAYLLSNVPTCAYWPMRQEQPSVGSGPPADVPVLFVHGEFDLRTPLASTLTVAGEFPQARVLTIPNTGHSASTADLSGCADLRVIAFITKGTEPAPCKPRRDPFAARALVPRSVGKVGAIAAARLTVADAFEQLDAGTHGRPALEAKVRGGGLRGGTFKGTSSGVVLNRYVFVKGFAVSGKVAPAGAVVLKVRGGKLRFAAGGKVTGTLHGKAVREHAKLQRRTVSKQLQASAGAARIASRAVVR
jgi:pimeloyl-ACP methyl ester carboxylesterase